MYMKRQVERMSHDTDLRVVRSRMSIRNAFMELLEVKSFEEITVRDITTVAMVSRGTFYLHFEDKYDLLDKIEKDMAEELDQFSSLITEESLHKSRAEGKPLPHLLPLLAYIEENPGFFNLVASNDRSMQFYGKLAEKYSYRMMEVLQLDQDSPLFAYKLQIGISATSSVLNKWISDGMKEKKEDIAKLITGTIWSFSM